jgi:transposase
MEKGKTSHRYSAEVPSRAVRMVLEHGADHASQWAAIGSIAAKIGCTTETLRGWVRQAEHDQGLRVGPSSDERERIKALERENRELRQANEILRKASAYFAMAEPDRRSSHDRVHRRASRRLRVEPLCRVLPIAPSTYHAQFAKRADPGRLSANPPEGRLRS